MLTLASVIFSISSVTVRMNIHRAPVRNTSDTERYTPEIAKAVHLCFSRDTKTSRMSHGGNANTRVSAAVSVLRLPVSNEPSCEVTSFMADLSQVKAEEWPGVKAGAEAKSVPRSRGWTRRNMSGASGSGAQGSAGGEQKLDVSEMKSPNVGDRRINSETTKRSLRVSLASGGHWRMRGSSPNRETAGT